MRWILTMCVAALLSGSAAKTIAADGDESPHHLRGNWLIAQRVYTPTDSNQAAANFVLDLGYEVHFGQKRITAVDDDKNPYYLLATITGDNQSGTVDLQHPEHKHKALHGAYTEQEGILTITFSGRLGHHRSLGDTDSQIKLVMKKAPRETGGRTRHGGTGTGNLNGSGGDSGSGTGS
jgi:hypothetical protein